MINTPSSPADRNLAAWLRAIGTLHGPGYSGDHFDNLAKALIGTLEADLVLIGRLRSTAGPGSDTLDSLVTMQRDGASFQRLENRGYRVPNSLFARLLREGQYSAIGTPDLRFPDGFPYDLSAVESSIGVAVQTTSDEDSAQGLIQLLFHRTLTPPESEEIMALLRILSIGVASELNRRQAETWLTRARYYAEEGMRHSPVAMLITDREGRIRQSNNAFRELSGYFARDIMNWEVTHFFPDTGKQEVEQCLDQLVRRQATHLGIETRLLDWQYRSVDVRLDCYSLLGENDQVRNIVIQLDDITEKKRSSRQINKLLQSIELSPVATVITDSNGIIEYVNPRFTELTGFSREESIGRKTSINASGQTPRETYQALWRNILDGREWQGELLNRRHDGSLYWARTTIFPITGAEGDLTNFVSLQEDISESRRLSLQLEYEATHDQLTGLLNRREFQRRLEQSIDEARIDAVSHALCFIDLDRFKVINDTSGHMAGDALLKSVGSQLQQHIRANDTVARVGGDEFALILRRCDVDKARALCEKIRQSINEALFPWDEQVYTVGLSIGLVVIDGRITDTHELLKQVDAACYGAKEAGTNRIVTYTPDDRQLQEQIQQSQWIPRLENALQNRRFRLYVQPIQPLQTRGTPRYEVLLRLVANDGSLISPGRFLPAAERHGLAPRVDRMVFDELYHFLSANRENTRTSCAFSLNLSGASISETSLLNHIISVIRDGPLPAAKLHFEITETAAIRNLHEARYLMEQLRSIGCRVILDDFGRGMSSFAYLKKLPVDILKIDGMFVRDMLNDHTDHIMVRMINELAHAMGMETVAEFIETEPVMQCLRQLGIDYGQGYHLARPFPLSDLDTP